MSETSGPMTWAPVHDQGRHGRPGHSRAARCASADDGEVICRGGNVFVGYLDDPDKTAEALIDGWLHSGDIGAVRRRRLPAHRRPQEGADHHRRRQEHQPGQPRGRAEDHPARRPGVRHRRPATVRRRARRARPRGGARRGPTTHGIDDASLAELAENPEVIAEIERGLAEAMEPFNHAEQVKKVKVLGEEWLPDSEVLTPTSKLKRRGHPRQVRGGDRVSTLTADRGRRDSSGVSATLARPRHHVLVSATTSSSTRWTSPSRRATEWASSPRTAPGSPRCSRVAGRAARARRGHGSPRPAVRNGRLPAPGARTTGRRDGAFVPRPTHRGRRRAARARSRHGGRRRGRARLPTTATTPRSTRWLALGARRPRRPDRPAVGEPRSARSAARPGHDDAVRRRSRAHVARRHPARAVRRVPPRRADERSRLRRPRPARSVPRRHFPAARSSCRTTGRSSSGRSRRCSSSTSTRIAAVGSKADGSRTSRNARPPASTRRLRTRRISTSGERSRTAPVRNGSGQCRAAANCRSARRTTTRRSATSS